MTDHPEPPFAPTPSSAPPPGRPRLFDDLAGVAGGAVSALMGLKDEAGAIGRARVEEIVRRLDLVRREEMDAALELAARARAGQEAAETLLAAVQARLAVLESRLDAIEAKILPPGGGGPGMIT